MPKPPPTHPPTPPLDPDDVPDTAPGSLAGVAVDAERTQPMLAIPPSGRAELRTAEGRRFVIGWDALTNILELSSRIAADDPTPPRGARSTAVRIHRADLATLMLALSNYLGGDELDDLIVALSNARRIPRAPMGC